MADNSDLPIGKVNRAAKVVGTGLKVSANYLKHYARKTVGLESTSEELNKKNASDIYNALSQMKGSVLKLAQMLSMDKGILPPAYVEQFSKSQYQTPPLSGPLVLHTLEKQLGKKVTAVFDTFDLKAAHAASIGQVHRATKNNSLFAVKIQYPGVAESIKSDIKLVTPFAKRMFDISNNELNYYLEEVEGKLLEETDYNLELIQATRISEACSHIKGVNFPKYYPELSGAKVLTMDWVSGLHLKEWLQSEPKQEVKNRVGQAIWDFYQFQLHSLKEIHADPHPGNFLIDEKGQLTVLDFGCTKKLSDDFYFPFFALILPEINENDRLFSEVLLQLGMIKLTDTEKVKSEFKKVYLQMLQLTSKPFLVDNFDFGDKTYLQAIYAFGESMSKNELFKSEREPRGNKDFIYVNRTFFGLYSLLSELGANINTGFEYKETVLNKMKVI